MKKICPRCGIIFEVASDPIFCSANCKSLFFHPNFPGFKASSKGISLGDSHTEIIQSKSLRQKQEQKTETAVQPETHSEPTKAEENLPEQQMQKPEPKQKQSVHYEIIYAKKRN